MLSKNIYYQEERKHASERFIVLVILTLLAFVLSGQSNGEIAEKSVLAGFVLLVVDLFSIAHYYFIARFPDTLVDVRKHLLLLIDVGLLTFFVLMFGENGIFLLPIYTVVVMRAGLDFGVSFFYTSLFLTAVSWFVLYAYSPYWQAHMDILAAFAIAIVLMPLFYLKYIISIHEEYSEIGHDLVDVEHDESHDELTGVATRKEFKDMMVEQLQEKKPFTLLFIDVDKLQAINDTYGKHVGDEVLKEVARRLNEEIDEDDFIARLGGDDFALVTTRDKRYFEKFLAKLERNVIGRHKVGSIIVPIELNIGISHYPEDAENAMMLSKYADEAMKKARADTERYHYFYHELSASRGA
jgi:diguanylate cyclase (GGDEF)-like protein